MWIMEKRMTQGNESLLQNDTDFPLPSRRIGLATYDLWWKVIQWSYLLIGIDNLRKSIWLFEHQTVYVTSLR